MIFNHIEVAFRYHSYLEVFVRSLIFKKPLKYYLTIIC